MRLLTKAQEKREQAERNRILERKLRFMGYRIAEQMAVHYQQNIEEAIPDLGDDIRRMAQDLTYCDDVVLT